MQLVLINNRIVAHGDGFIALGGIVINTETGKKYEHATIAECSGCPSDIDTVEAFSTCSAELAYATENPIDMAFLDINMRGMGGLALAEKIIEIHPDCKIVFCRRSCEGLCNKRKNFKNLSDDKN